MNTWSAAITIAKKDLGLYLRDRTGLLLGILLPVVMVAVFGAVMQFAFGGGDSVPRVLLWVVDEDQTEQSARFTGALRAAPVLSVRPRGQQVARDADQLRAMVADGEAHHALVIQEGFGASLTSGGPPQLRLLRDPGRPMESQLISIGIVQAAMSAAGSASGSWIVGNVMRAHGMEDAGITRVQQRMQAVQEVISRWLATEAPERGDPTDDEGPAEATPSLDMSAMWTDMVPVVKEDIAPPARPKSLGYQLAQSVSGMTVMMLMFSMIACSSMLLVERDQGTLRRLLVSSAPRHALLLGKFLFCLTIGVAQLTVLFAFGEAVFSIGAYRDPVTLLALSVTWAATATSFGVLIAVWARSQKQAEGLSTLLILVMAALGGCWFPLQTADLPWYGEVATRSMLTYWAMEGFQSLLWHQRSLADPVVLRAVGVQWGFVLVAGSLAWRLWNRRFLES